MTDTLLAAQQYGVTHQLPFAGALMPNAAYELLTIDPSVVLVDVRTNAERDWVGRVDIRAEQHFAVQWITYPGGAPNAAFMTQLEQTVSDKSTVILFLCRSAVRSTAAAKLATENGYTAAFDILEGFEGNKDALGHRKTVGGWCAAGLPWIGA